MSKNLYDMKLHEAIELDSRIGHSVMRVPGGWIYKFAESRIFVPFNNEFEEEVPDPNKIFQFRKEN